jgi:hypothetical protein
VQKSGSKIFNRYVGHSPGDESIEKEIKNKRLKKQVQKEGKEAVPARCSGAAFPELDYAQKTCIQPKKRRH